MSPITSAHPSNTHPSLLAYLSPSNSLTHHCCQNGFDFDVQDSAPRILSPHHCFATVERTADPMDTKVLYPNFHAEVHRYNAASVPTKRKSQRQPGPTRDAAGNSTGRPRSTGSTPLRELPATSSRPSTSPSRSQLRTAANDVVATSRERGAKHTHPSETTTSARRRFLPPCKPARVGQCAAASEATNPVDARALLSREQSFCRIEDFVDSNDGGGDNDDGDHSCRSSSLNEDDDEPEICTAIGARRITRGSALAWKPLSRQTAIRGELELRCLLPLDPTPDGSQASELDCFNTARADTDRGSTSSSLSYSCSVSAIQAALVPSTFTTASVPISGPTTGATLQPHSSPSTSLQGLVYVVRRPPRDLSPSLSSLTASHSL